MPAEPHQNGVVAVIRRHDRFLVIRRSQQVRAPGAFCFPGGGIELGETEEQALLRELREELGCDVIPRRPVWRSVTAWGISLVWWQCDLPQDARLSPDAAEVESVHWLNPQQMRANPLLLSSNTDFLDAWEAGRFTLKNQPDPGKTGG